MDIKGKRLIKGAPGNMASQYPTEHWFVTAGSWQYGAETTAEAIEAEKREQDLRFGTPHADNVPDPGASNSPQDATLSNPHNFSSNPGFMSSSTGDMATMGGPANGGTARISTPGSGRSLRGTGTIGRTAVASQGNVSLPAPQQIDPGGGAQVVTSGYSG